MASSTVFPWSNFIEQSITMIPELSNATPWGLKVDEIVLRKISQLDSEYHIEESIAIHRTAVVESGVVLKAPVIIGPGCFIGAHAYMRGGVWLLGKNSVGPGCELKSSILFPETNLAHFNFVGDSVLGSRTNFEAGSIIANHYNERDNKEISVIVNEALTKTGVTKFGALVGDGCRVGANAVLSPGTILKPNRIVARLQLVCDVKE